MECLKHLTLIRVYLSLLKFCFPNIKLFGSPWGNNFSPLAFLVVNENNTSVSFFPFTSPMCFSLDFNLKYSCHKLKKNVFYSYWLTFFKKTLQLVWYAELALAITHIPISTCFLKYLNVSKFFLNHLIQ